MQVTLLQGSIKASWVRCVSGHSWKSLHLVKKTCQRHLQESQSACGVYARWILTNLHLTDDVMWSWVPPLERHDGRSYAPSKSCICSEQSCSTDQPAVLGLQGTEWHCQESPTSSASSQKVRPVSAFAWKLLRSLVGSPKERWAMNNGCLFVRTLFSGQPKLFLLYGKSTLGDIFPNHITGCVRCWRLPNAGRVYPGSSHSWGVALWALIVLLSLLLDLSTEFCESVSLFSSRPFQKSRPGFKEKKLIYRLYSSDLGKPCTPRKWNHFLKLTNPLDFLEWKTLRETQTKTNLGSANICGLQSYQPLCSHV